MPLATLERSDARRRPRGVIVGKQRYPTGPAVDFAKVLARYFRLVQERVEQELPTIIEALKAQRQALGVRSDADLVSFSIGDILARAFAEARAKWNPEKATETFVEKVRDRATKDFAASIKRAVEEAQRRGQLGMAIAPELMAGYLPGETVRISKAVKEMFLPNTVRLIKSVERDLHDQLLNVLHAGLTSGKGTDEIAQDIQSRFGVAQSRAVTIARDQAGKLYNTMTRAQMEAVGLKTFIWKTAMDSRVRPKHRALHGKVFTWAQGANGIYPGQEVNCRCVAEVNPEELMDQERAAAKAEQVSQKVAVAPVPEREVDLGQEFFTLAEKDPDTAFHTERFAEKVEDVLDDLFKHMEAAQLEDPRKGYDLKEDVAGALNVYKRTLGYDNVNSYLRGFDKMRQVDIPVKPDNARWVIERLDHIIERLPAVKKPFTVYRGIPAEVAQKLRPGQVVRDPAYLSASLNPNVAMHFSYSVGSEEQALTVMKIRVPKGRKVLPYPTLARKLNLIEPDQVDQELEVILPRGTKFRIAAVTEEEWPMRTSRGIEKFTVRVIECVVEP